MIWDSVLWKNDLLRIAKKLDVLKNERMAEKQLFQAEKDIFVSFYIIRKLIEANKLSDKTVHRQYQLVKYNCKGKCVTIMNWHKIESLYDLKCKLKENHDLVYLCNQFIHSYVFVLSYSNDEKAKGVYFCSDRERRRHVFYFSFKYLIDILKIVGTDDVTKKKLVFNSSKQDFTVNSS